eukprot:1474977-Pyramimonas_sp.AAC.1
MHGTPSSNAGSARALRPTFTRVLHVARPPQGPQHMTKDNSARVICCAQARRQQTEHAGLLSGQHREQHPRRNRQRPA